MVGTIGHGLKLSIYKKVQVNSISFGIQNPVRFQIVSIQTYEILLNMPTHHARFFLKWFLFNDDDDDELSLHEF